MNKSININVSGGAASFGVVNQGDQAQLSGQATTSQQAVLDRHFDSAQNALGDLAREFEKDRAQLADVSAQLAALRDEVKAGAKDTDKGGGILKTVRDNYSWAYPAIKDFAKAVWPVLLTLL